jgi:hypothetical protein
MHVTEGGGTVSSETSALRLQVEDTPNADALFAGWQKTGSGEIFALYTITVPGHPFRGSTVSEGTLLKMHLRVPETPGSEEETPDATPAGSCWGCQVENQCIEPYHSKTGCSAFSDGEGWDGTRRREAEHEQTRI